jgi:hypothetical protein
MSRLAISSLVVLALAAGASSAQAQDAAAQPMPSVMQTPVEKSRAAIEECRDRRLRKEIATYKDSADCSDPQIFAAWKAANYPHMDLITAWLNAREAASEKVDQKTMTPEEFEREMDALTVRLTAEEARRQGGLVSTADSDLALQLPPAAKVVDVVTPAAQQKLAAKKSAAARARAATSAQGVGPPASGSVASLSTFDSTKPRAQEGVGGPFIPVNPNSPAARAVMARAAAAAAPGEGSSGLYAQVASQRSDAEARLVFRALQAQYPDLLGGRDAVIRRTDDANEGSFYRVEIGPLSSGQADALCGGLKSAGARCVPRYE